jgi:hypothetical protein
VSLCGGAAGTAAGADAILSRVTALMVPLVGARRSYVAAHSAEFPTADSVASWMTTWAGQWELAAAVADASSAIPSGHLCLLRLVQCGVKAVFNYTEADFANDPECVRSWHAEEAPFSAAGATSFIQDGRDLIAVAEWVRRYAGTASPPLIVDLQGHFCVVVVGATGAAAIFDSLPEGDGGLNWDGCEFVAELRSAVAAQRITPEGGEGGA